MKADVHKTDKRFLVTVAENLVAAQQEMDEFMLQLALGKAEAHDKFEELKHDFRATLASLKLQVSSFKKQAILVRAERLIEDLEILLAGGVVTSADAFEMQRAKLVQALESLEIEMEHWLKDGKISHEFLHEFEKFKLKLEILKLKYTVKKFEVKDSVRELLSNTKKSLHHLIDNAEDVVSKGEDTWDIVKDRIKGTYKAFIKAIH